MLTVAEHKLVQNLDSAMVVTAFDVDLLGSLSSGTAAISVCPWIGSGLGSIAEQDRSIVGPESGFMIEARMHSQLSLSLRSLPLI